MNRERYFLGECLTVKDDKGNASKQFVENKEVWGSYLEPTGAGNAKEFGFKEDVDGKFITRANIEKNSYLRHKTDVYHVVSIQEVRDIKTVLLQRTEL